MKKSLLFNNKTPKIGDCFFALVGFNPRVIHGKVINVTNIDNKGISNTYVDLKDNTGQNLHVNIMCLYDHKPELIEIEDEFGTVKIWE